MIAITATELRAYLAKRLAVGTPVRQKRSSQSREEERLSEMPTRPVSAGEINRELTVLERMFSLAVQAGKLVRKPHFPMLRENNVPVVTFPYVTGWRIASEVPPLQWRQVDLKAGEMRLDLGTTKNLEVASST